MDWFSWLSKTNLDPSLIYDYGVTFARNELQLEDACFFNHEFLQSMGISIAKHRLEILKLAQKENGGRGRPQKKLSGVIKKCLRKYVGKLVFREEAVKDVALPPEPTWHREKWRGAMVRKQEDNNQKPMLRSRTIALSGPLDGRMHEKLVANKVLKLSGPLDGRMNGRLMGRARSPRSSGPLDPRMMVMVDSKSPRLSRLTDARGESPIGYCPSVNKAKDDFDFEEDDHTLWPTLFQDLKPT